MAKYQAIGATSNAVRPMSENAALDSEWSNANVELLRPTSCRIKALQQSDVASPPASGRVTTERRRDHQAVSPNVAVDGKDER